MRTQVVCCEVGGAWGECGGGCVSVLLVLLAQLWPETEALCGGGAVCGGVGGGGGEVLPLALVGGCGGGPYRVEVCVFLFCLKLLLLRL